MVFMIRFSTFSTSLLRDDYVLCKRDRGENYGSNRTNAHKQTENGFNLRSWARDDGHSCASSLAINNSEEDDDVTIKLLGTQS